MTSSEQIAHLCLGIPFDKACYKAADMEGYTEEEVRSCRSDEKLTGHPVLDCKECPF